MRAGWKAQPYQLWSRANWGDRTWRINGGGRRLVEPLRQWKYSTRGRGLPAGGEEIRSNDGAVLYRSPEEDAKQRAQARWAVAD